MFPEPVDFRKRHLWQHGPAANEADAVNRALHVALERGIPEPRAVLVQERFHSPDGDREFDVHVIGKPYLCSRCGQLLALVGGDRCANCR